MEECTWKRYSHVIPFIWNVKNRAGPRENGLLVARDWSEERHRGEWLLNDYEFALGADESILELVVVMAFSFAGFIKNHE